MDLYDMNMSNGVHKNEYLDMVTGSQTARNILIETPDFTSRIMTNKHNQKDAYKIGFSATNTARQNSDYNKNKNTSRTCKNYEISETDQYTATID